VSPSEEYRSRLEKWRAAHVRCEVRFRQLGNARLATGVGAVVLAALGFGAGWISPWWLVAPLIVFIVLAIIHDRVDGKRAAAGRGVAYYERLIARLGNQWVGGGSQGERFRDPKHVYADDLDLFGRGSLFELLSGARTVAGENVLARWILAPSDREEVLARQQAVSELRPRVDLREEMALMGEDVRAAVDAKDLTEWGNQPPAPFFPGARVIAFALACAAVSTLGLFLAHQMSIRPFLLVILAEIGFNMAVRGGVLRVLAGASTPARELHLLGLLLQRLEGEPFTSPRLVALRSELETAGRTASQQIERLERRVEHLYAARNQFFRLIAAPLVWVAQFSMAVESWRRACGPHIGQWTAAVGEFEALCSLAGFAYERPEATFPDLLEQGGPMFDAGALHHPLIPPETSIANDVRIGDETRLWIISGSNMSGKSTLLRAIGLNAVLAWAGAPVTCARMRVSLLYIGASMRANDSLVDHRSRFYAEIERLRDIVDLARAGRPTLFLLDELLSGTNSHDRRIGAEALIRGLVDKRAIGLVTTHDLALAHIAEALNGRAVNVHFEDHLDSSGVMAFDYHLRPGVVTRSNALELMRVVGLDV
jgi:hypothetical protein